jgi:hypothetical protein
MNTTYVIKNYRNIEVRTSEFQFAHRRQPRGNGMWCFFLGGTDQMVSFNGSYAQCKVRAQQAAVDGGFYYIRVGS